MRRLRRYKALSLEACMQAARRDFGPDALIHAVRSRREGWRLFGRRVVHELLAGPAEGLVTIEPAGVAPLQRSLRGAAAFRAYGRGAASPVGSGAVAAVGRTGSDTDPLDLDRRRTRLLAQAMALRLERDAQARRLAAANERAVRASAAGDSACGTVSAAGASAPGAMRPQNLRQHGHSGGEPSCGPGRALPATAAAQRFLLVAADGAAAHGSPAAPGVTALAQDLRALRALVERVLASRARGEDLRMAQEHLATPMPWHDALDAERVGGPLAGFYATLIGQAMERELARRIIEEALDSLGAHERDDPVAAKLAVRARVAALLPACPEAPQPPEAGRGAAGARPHVISLVGPTGTGKTTTIAKLAADFSLRRGRRVGLITTDTFRIGAVDQLRTYADIVGLPLHVAESAEGLRRARESLADRDVILVDTAGRGHADRERLEELAALVRAANPDETHLVLSSTAGGPTLLAEAEAFACVGVDRVVVAKLDEAVGFGVLVGALSRIGRPLSWLTTGQQVPEDLEPARAERLAELVLGGEVA